MDHAACAPDADAPPCLQAKEAQDAAAACASAAAEARAEADAAAAEGSAAGRDFAARVPALTAAAAGAAAALRAAVEAQDGGSSVVEELKAVLSELSNATKVSWQAATAVPTRLGTPSV